ncbi:hypothetical protein AB0L88_30165 [Saccharopolyspora shandongensis]|uniref:hypothetical protein n=1 Tax=Saccharopolyspora shandongensis TaxID=418495 RepID=UPI00343EBF58
MPLTTARRLAQPVPPDVLLRESAFCFRSKRVLDLTHLRRALPSTGVLPRAAPHVSGGYVAKRQQQRPRTDDEGVLHGGPSELVNHRATHQKSQFRPE